MRRASCPELATPPVPFEPRRHSWSEDKVTIPRRIPPLTPSLPSLPLDHDAHGQLHKPDTGQQGRGAGIALRCAVITCCWTFLLSSTVSRFTVHGNHPTPGRILHVLIVVGSTMPIAATLMVVPWRLARWPITKRQGLMVVVPFIVTGAGLYLLGAQVPHEDPAWHTCSSFWSAASRILFWTTMTALLLLVVPWLGTGTAWGSPHSWSCKSTSWMTVASVVIMCTFLLGDTLMALSGSMAIKAMFMPFMLLLVGLAIVADTVRQDKGRIVGKWARDPGYLMILSVIHSGLPTAVTAMMNMLVRARGNNLKQLAMTVVFRLVMWVFAVAVRLISRRAVLPRHVAAMAFPVVLADDIFGELMFTAIALGSPTFYVALSLSFVRVVLRDTGLLRDAFEALARGCVGCVELCVPSKLQEAVRNHHRRSESVRLEGCEVDDGTHARSAVVSAPASGAVTLDVMGHQSSPSTSPRDPSPRDPIASGAAVHGRRGDGSPTSTVSTLRERAMLSAVESKEEAELREAIEEVQQDFDTVHSNFVSEIASGCAALSLFVGELVWEELSFGSHGITLGMDRTTRLAMVGIYALQLLLHIPAHAAVERVTRWRMEKESARASSIAASQSLSVRPSRASHTSHEMPSSARHEHPPPSAFSPRSQSSSARPSVSLSRGSTARSVFQGSHVARMTQAVHHARMRTASTTIGTPRMFGMSQGSAVSEFDDGGMANDDDDGYSSAGGEERGASAFAAGSPLRLPPLNEGNEAEDVHVMSVHGTLWPRTKKEQQEQQTALSRPSALQLEGAGRVAKTTPDHQAPPSSMQALLALIEEDQIVASRKRLIKQWPLLLAITLFITSMASERVSIIMRITAPGYETRC